MDETKRAEEFVKKDNEIVKGIDRLLDSVKEQMDKVNDKTARYCMNEAYTRLVSVEEFIDSAEKMEFKGIDLKPFIDDVDDGDSVNATVEKVDASVKTANVGVVGKVTC